MYECENELFELLRGWWDSQATDARNIVFDLRNNASFKNAVKAFGTRRAIPTARIDDVIRNSELQRALKGVGSSTLVLDVVNTGSTLEKHARALERLGMSVSKHALAAINKGGSTHTKVKDFDVWAFLCRPHDGVTEPCVQCALDLPQTDESAEAFGHLRAFDYLQMAEAAGWEVEPDAPVSVGQQYRMVPNFSRVLELYGDYIAYRLYLALRQWNFPADWFVVHPKEPDSTALSEALQIPLDRPLTIVRVPRKSIEAAQGIGNAWERVLEQEEEDRSWIEQLTALSGDTERGALILDIFNGSGSTFRSLESLLYHMRIQIVGYVCLGDFDPEGSRTGAIQLPKYALYEMHNPRVMHQKPTR
jgi:adenine/guanine phosphoribosyltransferase-like PRPP-binding protein